MKRLHTISLLVAVLLSSYSLAQTTQCNFVDTPPQNEEERQRRARFEVYRRILSYYTTLLPNQPDTALLMPVEGIKLSQIADTWGAPRGSGRSHEGQDIFAPLGTPIYSASSGFIYRIDTTTLGGKVVWVAGVITMHI